ncbi:MAG TPA: MBL fold metallo-hydrolase [Gammaproteobacteria bacterium]|nr:MBL fold metallo-hydrolase [Gammaproteobacteria bacterium]
MKTVRNAFARFAAAAVAASWIAAASAQPAVDFKAAKIEILPVQGNVYMLVGPVGNSTVQVGDDGVLIVDTQFAELSDKILAAIRTLSRRPIHYVLNTHAHPDHTGGNEAIAQAGSTIAGGNVSGTIKDAGEGATVVAHENVMLAMNKRKPPAAQHALPTDTFFVERKDLYFNGEAVQMFHEPAAHTDGDSIVYFRKSDVISAGDVFVTTTYPFIDEAAGGNINGIIAALNHIIELAVPADRQEGGTLIVPGHGRLCDEADVVEYRDMLTILRDRIKDMAARGLTLEQVQAAAPTRDYDPRYGATTGFWTTKQFVAAVYRGVKGAKP